MVWYLDTSALVKLVVEEAETDALVAWLTERDGEWVSADVTRTELVRAVRRVVPDLLVRAREVLDSITLIEVTSQIFDAAGRLDPPTLRTLDAVHVATALDLGDDLEGIVTYDDRLADSASGNGIVTVAPA